MRPIASPRKVKTSQKTNSSRPPPQGDAAASDRDDAVALIDQPIDGERGIARRGLVLDRAVELRLAADDGGTVDLPHHVIGQADRIWAWSLRRKPSMYLSTIRLR